MPRNLKRTIKLVTEQHIMYVRVDASSRAFRLGLGLTQ